ncbi:MAG TPA: phytanoyl-CoA dioxygenase family protein [Chthonomonas sp.]|jgi:ectoine hydroxylase|uniref:phytanoyl-CoA dioxygenase family protein n=1 Tax=Chthonomonas sp. TaxID=2282153 RepID=UPI002B4B775E|nr:phytanoyl-CoA dioxygenase family protein [Chthonomonas sp.]HLH78864.1 phytanoyl-CoA dioxygenase family protein [Chthonomonas sp.]
MSYFRVDDDHVARFERDGYLIVHQLLDHEETELLRKIAKADREILEKRSGRQDAEGNKALILLNTDLREDIYGAIARSRRIVDTMERLLGGEVYHWHHKMTMKEPFEGGAWEWHQDYGYWYNDNCLFPYMASVQIAVDPCTKENGCLQVIRGSHHLGRLDHGRVGDQTGADRERVEAALQRLELVYCELAPGDGVFFHCNLLHRSDANRSPHPRWTFLCCYNAARNDPFKPGWYPNYSYLEKWDDARIKEVGRRQWEAMMSSATA